MIAAIACFLIPAFIAASVVSLAFRDFETQDLLVSIGIALLASVTAAIAFVLLALVPVNVPAKHVSDPGWQAYWPAIQRVLAVLLAAFVYGLASILYRFEHPVKRTLVAFLVATGVFLLLFLVEIFSEKVLYISFMSYEGWVVPVLLLVFSMYPAALLFWRRPHYYDEEDEMFYPVPNFSQNPFGASDTSLTEEIQHEC